MKRGQEQAWRHVPVGLGGMGPLLEFKWSLSFTLKPRACPRRWAGLASGSGGITGENLLLPAVLLFSLFQTLRMGAFGSHTLEISVFCLD